MSNLSTIAVTQPVVATENDSTDDRLALSSQHVEAMTDSVIATCREVAKIAQDLETLALQNAARVKGEIAEHIKLTDSIKTQATQFGEMLGELAKTALKQANQTH